MMFKTRKGRLISLLGVLTLLVAAGVWLFGSASIASAAETTADTLKTVTQSATKPGLLGEGYLTHGGWGRGGLRGIDYEKLLADALGITTDELQTAYDTARTQAIEQAVTQGLITREQADEMLVWGGWGREGFGFLGKGRGPKGLSSNAIDEQALLADALDITAKELQAARDKANAAAIDEAVKEGIITQAQADEMLSQQKLQSYLDRDTLLAKALGMTAKELRAAYAEGKTLTTLMSERGLDAATVRGKLTSAYQEALAHSVKDGVITQEKADEMKNDPGWGLGFGGPMGHGRPMGPGGFRFGGPGGSAPTKPSTDDTSGTGFGGMGRTMRAGSAF